MDFERCSYTSQFLPLYLCYSLSVSSKLLSSKEKEKKIPRTLWELGRLLLDSPHSPAVFSKPQQGEQGGGSLREKRLSERVTKQTECLEPAAGEAGTFGKLAP